MHFQILKIYCKHPLRSLQIDFFIEFKSGLCFVLAPYPAEIYEIDDFDSIWQYLKN